MIKEIELRYEDRRFNQTKNEMVVGTVIFSFNRQCYNVAGDFIHQITK